MRTGWAMGWAAMAAGLVCAAAQAQEAAGKPWETTVALGVNLTDGNSETLGANASVVGQMESPRHDLRAGIEGSYGESRVDTTVEVGGTTVEVSERKATTENAKGYVNYKRKFPQLYAYTDDSILADDIAGIDYRLTLGAGVGRFLLDNGKVKLGVEGGCAFIREELKDDGSDDRLALRAAERCDVKLSDTAKVWESAEYIPDSADFGAYFANAELGLEAALNARSTVRVVVQDRFNSEPAPDRERNDVAVIGALTYKL
jgi:putative salt-induced outer membrane protein YdiY